MTNQFEIAGGSVTGRDHKHIEKSNQDAWTWIKTDDVLIAAVADGCGGSNHSEVGAKFGVRIVCQTIYKILHDPEYEHLSPVYPEFWDIVQNQCLEMLTCCLKAMGGSKSETVNDFFLFTIIGVVISDNSVVTFGIGDGHIYVNGEPKKIGPFPNNEPPYLAYNLVETSLKDANPSFLRFQIHNIEWIDDINSILLATDGLDDLIKAENKKMPGKEESVGPISQFWEEDRYFKNPDMVRRRLFLINRDVSEINWSMRTVNKENGHLSDDTTIVVIRRCGDDG